MAAMHSAGLKRSGEKRSRVVRPARVPGPVVVATIMRPEGGTGVQTHFRAYQRWLLEQGRDISVVTPFDAPLWKVAPVFGLRKVIHSVSGPASVRWYRRWHAHFLEAGLRGRLADGAPRVIYAQCPLSAGAALRARHSEHQKVVLVVHFNVSQADEWAGKGLIPLDGEQASAIRRFEAEVLRKVDGLVFVSAFMRSAVIERIPAVASLPHRIVPNFLADPGEPSDSSIDADLLCVGTLEQRKNQILALRIIAAAHATGSRLTLSIAGDGPDRGALEAEAHRLGIADSVRFHGLVRDAAALFDRHRACLHTALIENLPLTLLESMSRATPVFAVPVGGVPEVFADGAEGRYLPADDPRRAAALVTEWLADPARMAHAGRAARARFEARFARDVAAGELTAFLDSVAQSP
jgi:glycosyltransferase involved in cell wall biosynthesis